MVLRLLKSLHIEKLSDDAVALNNNTSTNIDSTDIKVDINHRSIHSNNVNTSNTTTNTNSDQILLFTRLEGGNYTCLGRVRAVGCNLHATPVQIDFELLDHDAIASMSEFGTILSTSAGTFKDV